MYSSTTKPCHFEVGEGHMRPDGLLHMLIITGSGFVASIQYFFNKNN
jgi:hypothetical protein